MMRHASMKTGYLAPSEKIHPCAGFGFLGLCCRVRVLPLNPKPSVASGWGVVGMSRVVYWVAVKERKIKLLYWGNPVIYYIYPLWKLNLSPLAATQVMGMSRVV